MNKIKVAICDDHKVVLNGIRDMLNIFPEIEIYGLFSSGEELFEELKHHRPDVLILDIQMPGFKGDEIAAIMKKSHPDVKILVMSGFTTSYYIKELLDKGAIGYLHKNIDESTLFEAIQSVYQGVQYIDPLLRPQFIEDLMKNKKMEHERPSLTRREKQILKLILEEYTSQEIANLLHISLRTVENQRVNLTQKIGVKNTAGLVKLAIEWKLTD